MDHTQIKVSQLRALVAIADYGSFGEAALQLAMSQSAISHAIATLEEELGVILLSRGRHGAQLTPVGVRVLSHARDVMRSLQDITKEASLERSIQGGQLRIAAFRSVATHILPEVLAQFSRRYPAIAIHIQEHDDYPNVEEDLRKGLADIGITRLPAGDEFETWELVRDEYIALFPQTYRDTGSELTWEQLADYPLIMAIHGNSCDERFYAHCQALGKSFRAAYQFREDSTIVSMVAQGLGATVIPRLAAEPIPKGVKVYSLPTPLFRVLGAATLANALLPPAVFAFLDLLKQNALSNANS